MTLLLETRNVSKYYGAFRALEQVSMTLHQGELVSVVGPNGAGKTTLVNLLTGLLEPSSGEVLFMGKNIAGVGPVELRYINRSEGEYLEICGPHLGALIGRHGNTLEALNLIFNNSFNSGVRTNRRYYTIDAEGYRAHRADQLKHLALATLERCVRDGKPQKLEPMLPSERKIVHLALSTSEAVRTESEGEEPERRVVIFPR